MWAVPITDNYAGSYCITQDFHNRHKRECGNIGFTFVDRVIEMTIIGDFWQQFGDKINDSTN